MSQSRLRPSMGRSTRSQLINTWLQPSESIAAEPIAAEPIAVEPAPPCRPPGRSPHGVAEESQQTFAQASAPDGAAVDPQRDPRRDPRLDPRATQPVAQTVYQPALENESWAAPPADYNSPASPGYAEPPGYDTWNYHPSIAPPSAPGPHPPAVMPAANEWLSTAPGGSLQGPVPLRASPPRPQPPRPMERLAAGPVWLRGGLRTWAVGVAIGLLALVGAIAGLSAQWGSRTASSEDDRARAADFRGDCADILKADAKLTEARANALPGLLGKSRQAAIDRLGLPYCTLGKTSVRSGAILSRETYPLGEKSRLVVAYEDDKLVGYGIDPPTPPAPGRKEIEIKQNWGIPSGATIAGHRVAGGLGSLSIAVNGPVFAPADGVIYPQLALISNGSLSDIPADCAAFASPQLPAYLMQLCGLKSKQLGRVDRGKEIGRTDGYLNFALLRHTGDRWVFVPPSQEIFESLLKSS